MQVLLSIQWLCWWEKNVPRGFVSFPEKTVPMSKFMVTVISHLAWLIMTAKAEKGEKYYIFEGWCLCVKAEPPGRDKYITSLLSFSSSPHQSLWPQFSATHFTVEKHVAIWTTSWEAESRKNSVEKSRFGTKVGGQPSTSHTEERFCVSLSSNRDLPCPDNEENETTVQKKQTVRWIYILKEKVSGDSRNTSGAHFRNKPL